MKRPTRCSGMERSSGTTCTTRSNGSPGGRARRRRRRRHRAHRPARRSDGRREPDPGKPAAGYDAFIEQVQGYVDAAQEGSLCSLVAAAPADEQTDPAGQLVHWLFAMGDTLPANLLRTLAVLATHPDQLAEVRAGLAGKDLGRPETIAAQDYLAGCIQEAMRLWPTTPSCWAGWPSMTSGSRVARPCPRAGRRSSTTCSTTATATGCLTPTGSRPEQWVSGAAAADWWSSTSSATARRAARRGSRGVSRPGGARPAGLRPRPRADRREPGSGGPLPYALDISTESTSGFASADHGLDWAVGALQRCTIHPAPVHAPQSTATRRRAEGIHRP